MDKKKLSQTDIRTKFTTPVIIGTNRENLFYKPNMPMAFVEAKDNTHGVGDRMPQALEYAEMLDVCRRRKKKCAFKFWACLMFLIGVLQTLGTAELLAAEVLYKGDETDFANPDRGLYAPIDPWGLENRWLQADDLSGLRAEGISLLRRIYTLREWRDRDLPTSFLDAIAAECEMVRASGLRLVIRFSYNWTSEDGTEALSSRPDASRSRIEAHLKQLQPVFHANYDVISHLQAGFVGHYGEWHASTHGLIDNNTLALTADGAAVLTAILAALPAERMVCVRYPNWHKRRKWPAPLPSEQAFTGSDRSRIGFHDDAFRWDDSGHAGFFHDEVTRAFVGAEAPWVVVGGEMAALNNDLMKDAVGTEADFAELGFSVLNREDGAGPTFDAWRTQGRYTKMIRQLGYRLRLVHARWEPKITTGSDATVLLRLANDGYARVYNPRAVELIAEPIGGGVERVVTLARDARKLLPGPGAERDLVFNLPADLASGAYRLALRLPDPLPNIASRSEYCIRLANAGLWDDATGRHNLGITVTVTDDARGR